MMASLQDASPAEVTMDFAEGLKDLAGNDKYAIQNLTMVAKEATFCAQELSEVLVKHIKQIQPPRKLPALYVLDSIVKNVGTPYTVYLGRNLYSTFMEAYSLVDGQTRKAMEAMLKTWKEPVFGSMDTRPVFAPELVRPIENALNKVRTVAMQHQRPMPQPYGTPVQYQGYAQPLQQYQNSHFAPPEQYYQQGFPQQHQQGQYQQPLQAQGELEILKRDLSSLIRIVEQDLSRDMYNAVTQTKLKALYDLNTILHTRQLGPAEFGVIAGQIHAMSAAMLPRPQPTPPVVSTPQWQPPIPVHQPVSIPQNQLNGLAALLSNVQKPSTPQVRAAVPSLQSAPHAQVDAIQSQASSAPTTSGSDLLAALTKAGLMKTAAAAPAATPVQAPVNPVQANLAALLGSLSKAAPETGSKIDLTNKTSLEMFRPELVQQLYQDKPLQCPQCGRRFLNTADGQRKKDLHLDWHFRINQRIADSVRGHHRNWYISETDWMKLVEFDESTATAEASAAVTKAAPKAETQPFIRTPAGLTRVTCSICQEEMKSSYHEQIQDWVFMNAAMNGGKIVHATCLAEMQQGVQAMPQVASVPSTQASLAAALAALGGQREASRTPDSMLGKRKAEDQAGGVEKVMRGS